MVVDGKICGSIAGSLFRVDGECISVLHFFSDTLSLDRQLGGYH